MQADTLTTAPFPVKQLQADICTIFLLEARKIGSLTDGLDAIRWNLLEDLHIYSPDRVANEFLTFDQVKSSAFARAMLDHYDFGFHAVTDTRSENIMMGESCHTWFAAYLLDLSESAYVREWDHSGDIELTDAIKRCLKTIEISNARCVLEGRKPFYHFTKKGEDDFATEGALTIRQLAMLANMEEMSLRSIISRKTPPILEIRKHNRSALIDVAVAKEWLKTKGCYRPVRSNSSTNNLEFSIAQSSGLQELILELKDHLDLLCKQDPAAKDRLSSVLTCHGRIKLNELQDQDCKDKSLMHDIAIVLGLADEWLIRRAQETYSEYLDIEIKTKENKLRQLDGVSKRGQS